MDYEKETLHRESLILGSFPSDSDKQAFKESILIEKENPVLIYERIFEKLTRLMLCWINTL